MSLSRVRRIDPVVPPRGQPFKQMVSEVRSESLMMTPVLCVFMWGFFVFILNTFILFCILWNFFTHDSSETKHKRTVGPLCPSLKELFQPLTSLRCWQAVDFFFVAQCQIVAIFNLTEMSCSNPYLRCVEAESNCYNAFPLLFPV